VVEAQRHRNGVPVTGGLYGAGGKVATATGRQHIEQTERTLLGYACACTPRTQECLTCGSHRAEHRGQLADHDFDDGQATCLACSHQAIHPHPALPDLPDDLPPTRPAVVLDPFGGTGTTALVAHALGRHGISNDMSADYCRLAGWRTSDPAQIAKVRGERKPVEQIDGQADLFDGDAA
jgi:hypothetical protein